MASPDSDEPSAELEVLADFLTDPEDASRRLPYVVGLFESDDERVRLAAAWTCCLAAVTQDETVDYLVRRLTDRLTEENVSLELTQALDFIAAKYPETVSDVLEEIEEESADEEQVPFPIPGAMTRNHYYGRDLSRDGVGRTRLPGEGSVDRRLIYGEEASGAPSAGGGDGDGAAEGEESRGDEEADDGDDDAQEGAEAEGGTGAVGDEDEPAAGYIGDPREVASRTMDVTPVAVRSRFEKLHIVSSRERQRYAQNYEALVGRGGEEMAVMFRMLRQPADADQSFVDDVRRELIRWDQHDDHPHLVRVLDWGSEPHPWLVTMFTGSSLAEQGRPSPARALADARDLAAATAHLHQHDVVHGGIDPKNVAYPDQIIAAGDRAAPLLDNVGLMHVYRYRLEPSSLLDPRYAAPEYFDRQFGRVDHLTDVYGLGAVIHLLFTGEPPYTGTMREVRQAVTTGSPPTPSAVAEDIPRGVDEVVAKAMATQKLTRYESVEHLRQELQRVEIEEDDGIDVDADDDVQEA